MPKPGKKKGQKSESSIKEAQEPAPPPVPEEENNQNVASSSSSSKASKRKDKKERMQQIFEASRQSSTTTQSSTEQSQASAEPPAQIAEVQPEPIAEVVEKMEEVQLHGEKRKRPRKKKTPASSDTSAISATPVAQSIQAPQQIVPQQQPQPPSQPSFWGQPQAPQQAQQYPQRPSRPAFSQQPQVPQQSVPQQQPQTPQQAVGQQLPQAPQQAVRQQQPQRPPRPAFSQQPQVPQQSVPQQQPQTPQQAVGQQYPQRPPQPSFWQQAQAPQQPVPQQQPQPSSQQSFWGQPRAPQQAVRQQYPQRPPQPSFWQQAQAPQQPVPQQQPQPPSQQSFWGQPQAPQQTVGQQLPQTVPQQQQPQAVQQHSTAHQPVGQQAPAPPQAHLEQQKPQTIEKTQISQLAPKPPRENVLCRYKIPTKIPGNSVRCTRLNILTNYLEMTFQPLKISRYDVSFSPDRPKKMLSKAFKVFKQQYFPKDLIAFDQMKNCYSLRPLKDVTANERFAAVVQIEDINKKMVKFTISMKATGVVDLSKIQRYMKERGSSTVHPTEEVQCIDVILRQGTLESYVKAGRQFFLRPNQPVDLGFGYEMWTGLFQSAIFTSKAFINIDVAHKGFPIHQTLIDSLKAFNLRPNMDIDAQKGRQGDRFPPEVDLFKTFIKGLRVSALMVGDTPIAGQRREYIVNGLVAPPGKLTFLLNLPNGSTAQTTVAQYYAKEKRYNIQYPYLNCVWVGPRDKTIYFPMELLEVCYGQPLSRQLNDTQVAKMVKEAATPPDRRMEKIKEVISSMNYSRNPDFKSFGLSISEQFYEVTSKILDPPSLDVGRESIRPRNGVWQARSLLKAQPLQAWGFVAIDARPGTDFSSAIQMISSTARQMGMQVTEPLLVKFDVKLTALSSILRNAQDNGINFMFVVVAAKPKDMYHLVKKMAEREVGMLTQCIKEATVCRMNPMTAKNILLKVNSKLMGINQAIEDQALPKCLRSGGVMIVGADVTHPSPDQSNIPSIAAVTASIDPKCYMYNIELSIQTPKKEMIVDFEDMMVDHLRVFRERNMGRLPIKIFVFRDGVSEGQFVQVMNSELAAVHAAYARLAGPGKKPEVLFLLVQKRHHTRFFKKAPNTKFNVEPGTVVDTDIVHASELDFYLVSHQAIKGTARPTRYHAVCNDGRIPDDEVEQLTYYLCHLYSRCMRAVSYPAPTYYAHLACLRARSLTHGDQFNNANLEAAPQRLHVLDKMLQHSRMFYV